jgi:hypothetical protein
MNDPLQSAIALELAGRPNEAAAIYRQLAHAGVKAGAFNLGLMCLKAGNLAGATELFEQIAAREPADAETLRALAHVRIEQARVAEAVDLFRRAGSESEALFYGLHLAGDHTAAHIAWGKRQPGGRVPPTSARHRLRIGYLSPHFREHTVTKFIEPVLAGHSDLVDVYCYSDVEKPDAVTARLKPHARIWRNTAKLTDEELEKRIRADQLDALVDLCGHMDRGRRLGVLARHPAPIVAAYVGYPHATGLPFVWRLTDAVCDPEPEVGGQKSEVRQSERLIRLPGCAWAYQPTDSPPIPPRLPVLDNGYVTFGSFNRPCKITPDVATTWAKLLARVPGSRLVALAHGGEGNADVRKLLEANGIDPSRFTLIPKLGRSEYLARCASIDVHLDPWPYNGMTTTCDLLWQGVPTVTLAGDRHVSRVGASLLRFVGLGELVADTPEAYVQTAAALAANVDRLAEMRAGLRMTVARAFLGHGSRLALAIEASIRHIRATGHPGESRGLGDTIKRFTHATGIASIAERVKGGPCGGCDKRQDTLNTAVPYTSAPAAS